MSNFTAFILYIVIVYSSYSHQLEEKVTCYTMTPDTAAQTIRYSREDLLNLRFSAQRTSKYDWSHNYSISPSPTDHHYSRRIETIISSRLPKNSQFITKCKQQRRNYNNLTVIPSYQSITNYKCDDDSLSDRVGSSCMNGRAGVVKPWSIPYSGYDHHTGVQCQYLPETTVRQTEESQAVGARSMNGRAEAIQPWSIPYSGYDHRSGAQSQAYDTELPIMPSRGTSTSDEINTGTTKTANISNNRMLKAPSLYYTNCRSLNDQKLDDLKQYATRYAPDLICLTETWFTKAREDNSNIQGYNLYTANRKSRVGGGVAIYLRSCIEGKVLEQYITPTISAIWLLLSHPQMPKMIIGCYYHPPNADCNVSLKYLEDTLGKLISKHQNAKLLLIGDFNQLPLEFFLSNSS